QACRVRFLSEEDILANLRVAALPADILPTVREDDLQLPPAAPDQRRWARRRARDDVWRPTWSYTINTSVRVEGDDQRAKGDDQQDGGDYQLSDEEA
ncbi:hypothetical protein HN873_067628, partial [Arachis hypogaea]